MTQGGQIQLADGWVDPGQQVLHRAGRQIRLTTRENELLVFFAGNPGRTITREELLTSVWGYPAHGSTEPVYNTVKRLRAKIEAGAHRHIVTVHGEGYRYEPPGVSPAPRRAAVAAPSPARFVGRQPELSAVLERLDSGRVVTLTGPGGVGKTRLAQEVMTRAERPTWFCDLSAVRTTPGLIRAVAEALDLPLEGEQTASQAEGVGRALAASPHALLVLDNLEQVPSAAEVIAGWLGGAALLATSRRRLNLGVEHALELGPLPLEDAIALFGDRAGPSFDRRAHAAEVEALVERLDRLPLAIELAAARIPDRAPGELLARLSQAIESPAPGAAGRHATLRAAVDWSWQLLGPRDQAVLARCAAFAGAFTVEAAEAVVGGEPLDALDALASLRAHSLIRTASDGRLALYAAVQHFAAEQLAADEVARQAALSRHAEWAVDEAERWLPDLDGAGHEVARRWLETVLADLRAAFERAPEIAPGLVGRLALAVDAVLRLRGGPVVRRQILERALPLAGAEAPAVALALGGLDEAEGRDGGDHLRRALTSERPAVRVDARILLGRAAASRGQLKFGLEELQQACDDAAEAGARRTEGRARAVLGEVLWRAGRVEPARQALEAALAIHREVRDLRGSALTAGTLCHVYRADGRHADALAQLDEAERAFSALQDPLGRARTLTDRGLHLSRMGRQDEARAALREAGAILDRLGVRRGREEVHLHLGESLLGSGADADARLEVHRSVAICRALGDQVRLSVALELLACAQVLQGRVTAAAESVEEALCIARAAGNRRSEATLLAKRGLCHFLRSAWPEALADFQSSEALHHERGADAMAGTATADCAAVLAALGHREAAVRAFDDARRLLDDPPETHWTGRMLGLLEATAAVLQHRHDGEPSRARARIEEAEVRLADLAEPDLATRLSLAMLRHARSAEL